MRAGVLVLGSLLTTEKPKLTGGCAIGSRPVDLHLFALKIRVKIKIKDGYIIADAKRDYKEL